MKKSLIIILLCLLLISGCSLKKTPIDTDSKNDNIELNKNDSIKSESEIDEGGIY